MLDQISTSNFANILTTVLVIATGGYVYLTWRIANANQKMLERAEVQHREETRPLVYAFLEFREQTVARLVIENMGRSPAYHLRAQISHDFFQFAVKNGPNIRDFPIFSEETSWFPPRARVSIDLAQGFNFDVEVDGRNITPSKFTVQFSYASKFEHYEETCVVDIAPYANMHITKSVSEQLGSIDAHLKKISQKS